MKKSEIIRFFDNCADTWDEEMIKFPSRVNKIMEFGGVQEGETVLDVACGTGVLIPDYLSRRVSKVVGVDISEKMIRIAREKFKDSRVNFICADIEELQFDELFDVCMVYNAFPHFDDPEKLIEKLAYNLKEGGRLTVAHGMSREEINSRHFTSSAAKVSKGLMECEALKEIFERYLKVDVCLSDAEIYVVSGVK